MHSTHCNAISDSLSTAAVLYIYQPLVVIWAFTCEKTATARWRQIYDRSQQSVRLQQLVSIERVSCQFTVFL